MAAKLRLAGFATALLAAAALTSCDGDASPAQDTAVPASESPQTTSPALTARPARSLWDVTIPVPDGWRMEEIHGGGVALRPEAGGEQAFLVQFFNLPPAEASEGNCQGTTLPDRRGPITLAGHVGSYESFCPATALSQGSWSVFLPTEDGSTWAWDYLGATGLESGPDAAAFMTVIRAFTAPNPPQKLSATP